MARLTEGIIRDLRTYLEENLPEKLALLHSEYEADYHEGIALPAPVVYSFGRKALKEGMAGYPRVEIMAPDGGGMSVTQYSQTFTDADHEIEIRLSAKGPDPSRLRLQVMRYGRALWELMVERFFSTTGDDYFALHGDGDITLVFEGPTTEALASAGDFYDSAILAATYSKQESSL